MNHTNFGALPVVDISRLRSPSPETRTATAKTALKGENSYTP